MLLIRIFLLPLSLFYGMIIQLRNLLYDAGVFKSRKFDVPVISVGNITAGGAGKTPFSAFLAGKFTARDKRVAVISRGYGRKSRGFYLVTDGLSSSADAVRHGDEAVLLSLLVPKAIVAVAESRAEAIEKLGERFDLDVIILDDGFQHRSVRRDVDIVVLKDMHLLLNKWLLPSGLLREFRFNLKRADILIDRDDASFCRYQPDGLFDMDFQKQGVLADLTGKACIAFAGIADPFDFEKSLLLKQITVRKFFTFKDHYLYKDKDITALLSQCREDDCEYLLCTQKDMVKIRQIEGLRKRLQREDIKLLAPGLIVSIRDESSFLKKIESHLDWFGKR